MATWILTADRAGARIFTRYEDNLSLFETIPHEEGRLKANEVNSDRPGRVFDSAGMGRHSMGQAVSAEESIARDFARSLAEKLHDGRVQGSFTRLVLIAEPRFLGLLREALDSDTSRMVVSSIAKNLQSKSPQEIAPYVLDSLRQVV